MTGSGIFISALDYRSMAPDLQTQIAAFLAGKGHTTASSVPTMTAPSPDVPGASPDGGEESEPSDLSVAQARKFLEKCSDRTKSVLRAIVSGSRREFELSKLAKDMDSDKSGLGGVWAGITKRSRTVLGDKDAALLAWEWDDEKDDWIGSTSEMTYHSMRKALGLE